MFVFFEKIAESFASKAELKPRPLHNTTVTRHFPKKHVFCLRGSYRQAIIKLKM